MSARGEIAIKGIPMRPRHDKDDPKRLLLDARAGYAAADVISTSCRR